MDYLDPRKRRAYNIRLILGYILIAIVIGLGTVIFVYGANGYGINTKTGQIVQNALLFVDSNPGGAQIYLNGQNKNTSTSARLVLPTGNYTLKLTKDGYRDWTRQFTLNEQSVARFVYPLLFPLKPQISELKTYTSLPGLITESPDRHWILVEASESSAQTPVFDEYDTSTLDKTVPDVSQISIPIGILSNYSVNSKLTEVEWSTDDDHVLLLHTYPGGNEFVVFSRTHPDTSFNVNKIFNTSATQVSLFDKKVGQLYIYNQSGGTLQLGDTGSKQLGPVILRHVLAFKPYGRDLVTYVTDTGEPPGKAAARIWNSGKIYKLNEFSSGNKYLIDAAQFQGNFYYAAGSDTTDRINVYKNPLDSIKDPAAAKALPLLALRISGGQKIGFSDNARFIGIENGQHFAVFDIETGYSYQYPIDNNLLDNMSWMDGHRFIGNSDGKVMVMDYDGTNKQMITPSAEASGALFSRDYKHMLSLAPATDGTSFILQDVDMRAGSDLPKK